MSHIADIGIQLCLYALLPYGCAWFYNQIKLMTKEGVTMHNQFKPVCDEFLSRDWPLIRFVAVAAIVLAVAVLVRVMV